MELGGRGLDVLGAFAVCQVTSSHQELDFLLRKVAESEVPAEELLLCRRQVHVRMAHGRDSSVEELGDNLAGVLGISVVDREVALGVREHFDGVAHFLGGWGV